MGEHGDLFLLATRKWRVVLVELGADQLTSCFDHNIVQHVGGTRQDGKVERIWFKDEVGDRQRDGQHQFTEDLSNVSTDIYDIDGSQR